MAQIPNKKHVRVTITGAVAANYLIPDSGHYTKFTFSVPANVSTIGDLEGDLGGGFLALSVFNLGQVGTVKYQLAAGEITSTELHAPCPGGLRLGGMGITDVDGNPASTTIDVMMTGSLYSSGRNS